MPAEGQLGRSGPALLPGELSPGIAGSQSSSQVWLVLFCFLFFIFKLETAKGHP